MTAIGDPDVSVESAGDGLSVVRVADEVDAATVGGLEEALARIDPGDRIVVDLTECTFLDSSAVRVLVSTARSADTAGGSLALVASDPGVLRILEIAAADTLVPVHPTLDEAL